MDGCVAGRGLEIQTSIHLKDGEPTELAIVLNFISGIIISIVAVISGVLLVLG